LNHFTKKFQTPLNLQQNQQSKQYKTSIKLNSRNHTIMKITKLFLLSCLICIAGACNDDDDDDSSSMTSEEAADVVASSLAINSSGLATAVDASVAAADAAVEASTGGRTAACGYSDQESFTATSTPGAIITYAYNYTYSYLLTCGVDVPQSLSVTSSYTGEFDAPRLASQHTGASDFTVTALDESTSSYIINGGYNRAGAFQSKIRNKNSSTSTVNFIVDALTVDKTNQKILSGSASVAITGSVTGKGSFTYTASVVFEGDGNATVTINSNVYSVDLITGTVVAQ
jgi:hypothetical protein